MEESPPVRVNPSNQNKIMEISTAQIESVSHVMYATYCHYVGGTAYNGEPLPDWTTFSCDPSKQQQVNAWREAGKAAILHLCLSHAAAAN